MFHRANTKKETNAGNQDGSAKSYRSWRGGSTGGRDGYGIGELPKSLMPEDRAVNTNASAGKPETFHGQKGNNSTSTVQKPLEREETKQMNTPKNEADTQGKGTTPVDIPGNSFQRPGQSPAGRGGSYPGSSSSSYSPRNPIGNMGDDSNRKLVIGRGITLSGEIESCDHLIVEGTVEAALKGANLMDITETGSFFGTVEIGEAVIAGQFEGDLTVKGRLTIKESGSIVGSIAYKELAVEAGATIDGTISPLDANAKSAGKSRTSKSSKKGKVIARDRGSELPLSDQGQMEAVG